MKLVLGREQQRISLWGLQAQSMARGSPCVLQVAFNGLGISQTVDLSRKLRPLGRVATSSLSQ